MKDKFNFDNPAQEPEKKRLAMNPSAASTSLYDWLKSILITFAVIVACFVLVFRIVRVDGPSMNATLENGDMLILTNIFYTPHDGDIVVVSHTEEHAEPIIKRVIATEGQTLELDYENDRVIVDGVVLNETYLNNGVTFGAPIPDYEIPDVVSEGKVFVMGDNRNESMDSRDHRIGLVNASDIIGKAQFVVFPWNGRFGYLYN